MKKILLCFILLIAGCSKYKMADLPESVIDNITIHINAYLIRPTNTSSELFKEKFGIDINENIDISDFRLLLVDWNKDAYQNNEYIRGEIHVIDYGDGNPYIQENQKYPENPWEKQLKEYVDFNIRLIDYLPSAMNNVTYNMFEGYDYDRLDISQLTGSTFYFGGASEEEIINYIQRIPLSIRLDNEDYTHYTYGYCKHTYLINDVNLFVEDENGEFIKY